ISNFYVELTAEEKGLLKESFKQYWLTEDSKIFDELKSKDENLYKKVTALRSWLMQQYEKVNNEVKAFLKEIYSTFYEDRGKQLKMKQIRLKMRELYDKYNNELSNEAKQNIKETMPAVHAIFEGILLCYLISKRNV
uniref:Fatty-acid and retinol-binding protein 1 n=1 Tax=Syphacia muris TaxID=451379 RepID=A0A158R5W9_9BILA